MKLRIRIRAMMLLVALIALSFVAYQAWDATRSLMYVQGDVKFPGKVILNPGMTVIDALSAAGGPNLTTSALEFRLIRLPGNGPLIPQLLPVDLTAIVNAGDPTTNYQLLPGDRLMVYRKAKDHVGILTPAPSP